jgi:hypothetical protein
MFFERSLESAFLRRELGAPRGIRQAKLDPARFGRLAATFLLLARYELERPSVRAFLEEALGVFFQLEVGAVIGIRAPRRLRRH